jgi:hypothetical protein
VTRLPDAVAAGPGSPSVADLGFGVTRRGRGDFLNLWDSVLGFRCVFRRFVSAPKFPFPRKQGQVRQREVRSALV